MKVPKIDWVKIARAVGLVCIGVVLTGIVAASLQTQPAPVQLNQTVRAEWAMQAIVLTYAKRLQIPEERAALIVKAVDFYAHKYDLDPWLVLGLIKVESSGNPDAISYKGALGLMQIMPDTADFISEALEQDIPTDALLDIRTNIWYGSYYLSLLLDRFDRPEEAIASYYWGPTYIQKCLNKGLMLPTEYTEKVLTAAYGRD